MEVILFWPVVNPKNIKFNIILINKTDMEVI